MNKYDNNIETANYDDHLLGLEIIRVLGLRRKRSNGRIETTHGDKTPCGLSRTLRDLTQNNEPKEVKQ
jgi:hypothetical protein